MYNIAAPHKGNMFSWFNLAIDALFAVIYDEFGTRAGEFASHCLFVCRGQSDFVRICLQTTHSDVTTRVYYCFTNSFRSSEQHVYEWETRPAVVFRTAQMRALAGALADEVMVVRERLIWIIKK